MARMWRQQRVAGTCSTALGRFMGRMCLQTTVPRRMGRQRTRSAMAVATGRLAAMVDTARWGRTVDMGRRYIRARAKLTTERQGALEMAAPAIHLARKTM